jgi:type III secretory pathway component EscU
MLTVITLCVYIISCAVLTSCVSSLFFTQEQEKGPLAAAVARALQKCKNSQMYLSQHITHARMGLSTTAAAAAAYHCSSADDVMIVQSYYCYL